ncbi:uncharacterized protein LOC116852512 [Odontomachus brunneus]|uniref:uncharacterized protein LOC116852512 n=1 Tax=Odontomachus brunneus TaxID=486640 RepID=UPI0013F1B400|nr:uncharacterized protein LOC116852512 [Odontomachus brunneus]
MSQKWVHKMAAGFLPSPVNRTPTTDMLSPFFLYSLGARTFLTYNSMSVYTATWFAYRVPGRPRAFSRDSTLTSKFAQANLFHDYFEFFSNYDWALGAETATPPRSRTSRNHRTIGDKPPGDERARLAPRERLSAEAGISEDIRLLLRMMTSTTYLKVKVIRAESLLRNIYPIFYLD